MRTNDTRRRSWRIAAVLVAGMVPLIAGLGAAPAWAATPAAGRQLLSGTHPAWATTSADIGPVAAGSALTARVYLAGRDAAGLAAYAAGVADPNSPDYQHYLTPARFRDRFGAGPDQVAAVASWLTGAGLRVTTTTPHYLAVTGTAAEAQRAFGTELHIYRTPNGPQRAPRSAISVPASVAPAVLTVTGLNTAGVAFGTDLAAQPSTATPLSVNVGTCSDYYGQKPATGLPPAYGEALSYDVCGYTPDQLRAAYGVNGSGLTGRGATVAVVDPEASPTIAQDVDTYSARHGLPVWRPGQFSENLPADIGTSCPSEPAYGEESLDVEAVHTMAPDANVVYVGADCTNIGDDLLDAETRIVDHHLADIVSDSWHLGTEAQVPPELTTAYQRIFQQGAVEGIGFYFSSGDHGDWSPFTPDHRTAVQYPGSDPWVTCVGGTSLAVGSHANYRWEISWGDDLAALSADGTTWTNPPGTFDGGAGGGPSAEFAQPFYQRGVVPDALSHPGGAANAVRVMPDIAADADPATGMLIGLTGTLTPGSAPQYVEGRAGGTSEATPLIAGIQADAQQARHGVPIGFADPAIYARYHTPAYRDVTDTPAGRQTPVAVVDQGRDLSTGALKTGLLTLAHDTSLTAAPGYDVTTGIGSPTRFYLDSYRLP